MVYPFQERRVAPVPLRMAGSSPAMTNWALAVTNWAVAMTIS
jgi:hypothetical protein